VQAAKRRRGRPGDQVEVFARSLVRVPSPKVTRRPTSLASEAYRTGFREYWRIAPAKCTLISTKSSILGDLTRIRAQVPSDTLNLHGCRFPGRPGCHPGAGYRQRPADSFSSSSSVGSGSEAAVSRPARLTGATLSTFPLPPGADISGRHSRRMYDYYRGRKPTVTARVSFLVLIP